MTGNDEELSLRAIDICRSLGRKLAQQTHAKGISSEDIAIGQLYALADIVGAWKGDWEAALAWLSDGLVLLDAQARESVVLN